MLNISVWIQTSNVLIPVATEEDEEPQMPFEWHCLQGMAKNMLKLNEEFNKERNLEQMRIFIQGPPSSGKSYYA
eukprot:CAMPEP_0168313250 /NCGR_PEP_ID=MMETSP0210-20121227/637_1 /TAXON_ID=40633 /ORGANISM="Condylostoma magnum, Strain COL2" /LENGTH=73 /DNA_ID=CAMNT_0008267387 /DNA_START=907 /DNA_END=1128 /DNA_ORIENTATION=+